MQREGGWRWIVPRHPPHAQPAQEAGLRSDQRTHARFCRAARLWLAAIIVLAACCALPAAAQGDAILRGEPAVLEIAVGESAGLNIVLADARDVYALDVRATYDPQVVEVVDADPGQDDIQLVPGTFLRPDFVARNGADNTAGALRYAITQVNPTAPASGAGVVFTVQFRGKTVGEMALAISPVELADRQGRSLPVTAQSVTIRVVASQAPAPVSVATQTARSQPAVGLSPTPAALPAEPAIGQPAGQQLPTPTPRTGLPCTGGTLPPLGLLALAGWGAWRRRRS